MRAFSCVCEHAWLNGTIICLRCADQNMQCSVKHDQYLYWLSLIPFDLQWRHHAVRPMSWKLTASPLHRHIDQASRPFRARVVPFQSWGGGTKENGANGRRWLLMSWSEVCFVILDSVLANYCVLLLLLELYVSEKWLQESFLLVWRRLWRSLIGCPTLKLAAMLASFDSVREAAYKLGEDPDFE